MLSEKVYSGRLVRPGVFGGSPEWTAGVRRHPAAVVAAAVVLAVCACIPYAGFPALYLAAAACGSFYAANEPLQLLLLPEKGAARLLARKVLTAWRNYFLTTAPFAALALLAQPRSAWMAAAWAPLSALVLLYFVAAKYARYDPADESPRWPLAARLGAAGFLVPPLLPLSLCLVVSYLLATFMITIDALRICDGERTLLDGVTMHLPANAVHGIAGEGRSALLQALYGLMVPDAGRITAGGHPLRRCDVGFAEAEPRFWPGLTVRDCLDLAVRYNPGSNPAAMLRRLPVPLDAEAAALPAAERKRLALVLLLLNPKRVLLLDEPFRGLDVESAFMLRQLILQLGSEGRTVLVAARLAELDGICDDFYVLGGGVVRGRYEHYEFARAVREAAASGIAEK